MSFPLTAVYAVPMVALFMALSIYVIRFRRANRVALGTADSDELLARVRAQANCAEYLPLGLVLLMLAEGAGAGLLFHSAAVLLVTGRMVHGLHLALWRQAYALRPVAIIATFAAYVIALVAALI